jgi:hypothetical protein
MAAIYTAKILYFYNDDDDDEANVKNAKLPSSELVIFGQRNNITIIMAD